MKYKGIIKGSRQVDFAVVVGTFGVILENLPLLRTQLGDWYGWIFIGLSVAIYVYRAITTTPLGEKK